MTFIDTLKTSASRLTRAAGGTVLGVGLALSLVACGTVPERAPSPGPALWAGTDEVSTVYLFGTVHVLRPELEWRAPHIDAALSESSALWLEVPNVDDQAAAAPLIQQYGLSQTPLSSRLTAEDNALLAQAGAAIGMPAAAFEPMRPWLAGLTVSVAALARAGYDPASGVDPLIKAAAVEAGLPVRGFETLEQQLRFFADMPEDLQIAFLREALQGYQEAPVELDALVTAWAAGDVAGIETTMVEEMKTDWPDLYERLLVDRNTDWAGQIETLMEGSGTVFVAVGAAHLAGEDSVQSMLRARGIDVERR